MAAPWVQGRCNNQVCVYLNGQAEPEIDINIDGAHKPIDELFYG